MFRRNQPLPEDVDEAILDFQSAIIDAMESDDPVSKIKMSVDAIHDTVTTILISRATDPKFITVKTKSGETRVVPVDQHKGSTKSGGKDFGQQGKLAATAGPRDIYEQSQKAKTALAAMHSIENNQQQAQGGGSSQPATPMEQHVQEQGEAAANAMHEALGGTSASDSTKSSAYTASPEATRIREQILQATAHLHGKRQGLEKNIRDAVSTWRQHSDTFGRMHKDTMVQRRKVSQLVRKHQQLVGQMTQAALPYIQVPEEDRHDLSPMLVAHANEQGRQSPELLPQDAENLDHATALVESVTSRPEAVALLHNVIFDKSIMRSKSTIGSDGVPLSFIARDAGPRSIVHETFHALAVCDPSLQEQAEAFHSSRTSGEEPISMKEAYRKGDYFPITGQGDLVDDLPYEDNEMTRPDNYPTPYAGRVADDGSAAEIIPVGGELLTHDPVGFAMSDPDYFHFIVDALRGNTRD